MTSRQLQYYAKQYEALSHFQETMRKERHERKNRNMELLMLAQKGAFECFNLPLERGAEPYDTALINNRK